MPKGMGYGDRYEETGAPMEKPMGKSMASVGDEGMTLPEGGKYSCPACGAELEVSMAETPEVVEAGGEAVEV